MIAVALSDHTAQMSWLIWPICAGTQHKQFYFMKKLGFLYEFRVNLLDNEICYTKMR